VADPKGRLPGRGGYYCPEGQCLERVLRLAPDRLKRAFRLPVAPDVSGLAATAEEMPARPRGKFKPGEK
jgi:predicted RNA-binding protein YlxR (DUF448 family)